MGLNDLHFTKFELQEIFWNILYAFFDNDIIITNHSSRRSRAWPQ